MSYHINKIDKGVLGSLSKIQEELDEAVDAEDQDCKIMILLELSDMIGATTAYLKEEFPDISIQDLISMSIITKRAFDTGDRK